MASQENVTAKLIADHNASAAAGFPDRVDPRMDSNHPLHDIVCGWCGEVHTDKQVSA